MSDVAVADTGPLIYLGELDVLSALTVLDEILVPETVYRELEAGELPADLDELQFTVVEADRTAIDAKELDPGETAALAIARDRDAMLLTDDLDARERAGSAGVEVHGTIGIIALAYGRGRFEKDEAKSLLRQLQQETRLYVTSSVVERGIEMVERDS